MVIAQNEQLENTDSRTPQEILDSYGGLKHAVIHMTRDEWEVIRAWDEFDENAYLAALREFKASLLEKKKASETSKVQQSECGCWVEPDDTYITLVPPPG